MEKDRRAACFGIRLWKKLHETRFHRPCGQNDRFLFFLTSRHGLSCLPLRKTGTFLPCASSSRGRRACLKNCREGRLISLVKTPRKSLGASLRRKRGMCLKKLRRSGGDS